MKKLPAVLVINQSSRRSRQLMDDIMVACQKHSLEVTDTFVVSKKGDTLDQAMRKAVEAKETLILVGGGDGTISDAVDYVAHTSKEMGIIPLGTTNNFARSIGMPKSIDDCIKRIVQSEARPVDLGKINNEYFANAATIGVSANIASNVTNRLKKYFGRVAYGLVGISELIKHKPFYVRISDVDADMEISMETHQLVIANGRYHAGREIASDAELTSRELVLFALGGRSKIGFIFRMIDFYSGRRKSIRHHSYVLGRNIRIHTTPEQKVELDGELKFTTPVELSVAAKAVKVRY